jgi:hypothetical protein
MTVFAIIFKIVKQTPMVGILLIKTKTEFATTTQTKQKIIIVVDKADNIEKETEIAEETVNIFVLLSKFSKLHLLKSIKNYIQTIEKQVHNIQQTDHLFLFWLVLRLRQAKIKTNGGCCFSLAVMKLDRDE